MFAWSDCQVTFAEELFPVFHSTKKCLDNLLDVSLLYFPFLRKVVPTRDCLCHLPVHCLIFSIRL